MIGVFLLTSQEVNAEEGWSYKGKPYSKVFTAGD